MVGLRFRFSVEVFRFLIFGADKANAGMLGRMLGFQVLLSLDFLQRLSSHRRSVAGLVRRRKGSFSFVTVVFFWLVYHWFFGLEEDTKCLRRIAYRLFRHECRCRR